LGRGSEDQRVGDRRPSSPNVKEEGEAVGL
jgi:hypothetical protein